MKQENLNSIGLLLLLGLMIFLYKKENKNNTVVNQSEPSIPSTDITENNPIILKVPKQNLTEKNTLKVLCPTLRKYG